MNKRYLLDTCTFIWAMTDPLKLPNRIIKLFESDVDFFVSAVSLWEIILLHQKKRIIVPNIDDLPLYRRQLGFKFLALDESILTTKVDLPAIHSDPFDRMLVQQALVHDLVILTPDHKIQQYSVSTIWK
jgi:PIN domain nuclease of toxin-antitoxin system